jgi:hypothetical protein
MVPPAGARAARLTLLGGPIFVGSSEHPSPVPNSPPPAPGPFADAARSISITIEGDVDRLP